MSQLPLGRYRFHINRDLPVPLAQQICEQIRCAISDGHWRSGWQLPSTRQLAQYLAVSRNTVSAVYDQLGIEGYLFLSRGRRATVVEVAPTIRLAKDSGAPAKCGMPLVPSKWGLRLRAAKWPANERGPHRPSMPSVGGNRDFPHAIWGRCLRSAARHGIRTSDGRVNRLRLQQLLVDHLREHRGVHADTEQVFILPTAQSALDLVARVVLDPTDIAWVEGPGYEGARAAFEATGATVVGIDIDQSGLLIMEDPTTPRPRCIFLTASHPFPTERLMSMGPRLALLQFASTAGAYIIEDDYDGELHYQSEPVSALQGLDKADRVFYVGSFSKSMPMGTRAGYLVVPHHLVDIMEKAQRHSGQMVSLNVQDALSAFIGEGHYASHLRKMSRIYRMQRDPLCDALSTPDGGVPMLTELRLPTKDKTLVRCMSSAGVSIRSLSHQYLDATSHRGIFMGVAAWHETEIDRVLQELATLLHPKQQ